MKELTIKEKAKLYDEAKARMSKAYNSNRCIIGFMNEIFPEFKDEDEDEAITRMLTGMCLYGMEYMDWLKFYNYIKKKLEKPEVQEEINLVEILKHCPRETELYSPLYGKLWLAEVDEKNGIITCYKHHLEEGCTRAILQQEDTVSFYSNGTTGLPDYTVSKDCMLFLYDIENQGEKSANKIELKFHEGDWVVSPNGVYWHIDRIENNRYEVISNTGERSNWSLDTNIYHRFTIADAKDGDVLVSRSPFIYGKQCPYGGLNWCDNKFIKASNFIFTDSPVHPATKEQRDTLFKAMADAGYEFDFEKKELKKIENEIEIPFGAEDSELQEVSYYIPEGFYAEIDDDGVIIKKGKKPAAWSKEDDEMFDAIIADIRFTQNAHNNGINQIFYEKEIDWLKSLKQRYTWKPSDEQMRALHDMNLTGNISYTGQAQELIDLYKDLKKLRKK